MNGAVCSQQLCRKTWLSVIESKPLVARAKDCSTKTELGASLQVANAPELPNLRFVDSSWLAETTVPQNRNELINHLCRVTLA